MPLTKLIRRHDSWEVLAVFTPHPDYLENTAAHARKRLHDVLVSGKYKQAFGTLKEEVGTETHYCAVGAYLHSLGREPKSLFVPDVLPALPQAPMSTKVAMCQEADCVYPAIPVSLFVLNDHARLSFPEIAKLIYPEKYDNE